MKTKDYRGSVNMAKYFPKKKNKVSSLPGQSSSSPDKLYGFIDKFLAGDMQTHRALTEYDPNARAKFMVNPTTGGYERIDNSYTDQKLVDDQLFQMKDGFITNKAGERLPTLKDAINRNDKLEAAFEPKEFENILKRLKKKNIPLKNQTVQPTQVADKPKPIEPIPFDWRTNPNWWDLTDDDAPKPTPPSDDEALRKLILQEKMAGLKEGIGTLFSKKISKKFI